MKERFKDLTNRIENAIFEPFEESGIQLKRLIQVIGNLRDQGGIVSSGPRENPGHREMGLIFNRMKLAGGVKSLFGVPLGLLKVIPFHLHPRGKTKGPDAGKF